ncbi:MAG: ROK family protein [Acidobacteriia bacterium]|nr:ROK family protein [Terriglobia bacterium]
MARPIELVWRVSSHEQVILTAMAFSAIATLPSRIAQSGYNAQTIVSENLASADSGTPLAIGVDIGATAIKAAIVGVHGDLVESFHEPSPRTTSALQDFVHSVLKCAKLPVRGIGIGCKGIIDAASSRVKSLPGDLHFLEGLLLSEVIAAGDLPVSADNDARTALIAEVLWGAARGRRNVVMLTLGTGVGGAVLVDGAILRGAGDAGGHLGHVTVDPRGGLCICGNYGCLETLFSSRAIESDYWAHLHRAAPAKLSVGSAGQLPDTEAIFRAAAKGDECARYVLDRALEYLGAALVSFLHTFDPEIFILGGSIAAAGPQLIAPIQDKIAQRSKILLGREVPIVFQKTVGYGGVAGAAGLVFLQQRLLAI